MGKNDRKNHKWRKKPEEWASELKCSVSTVRHNGEEWCQFQTELLQAGTRNERKAKLLQREMKKADADHGALLSNEPDDLTPEERQKQRIYQNTMSILDKCLIKLEVATELTPDQARLINAQLKAVELVVRVSS